jgi:hypothetical protein
MIDQAEEQRNRLLRRADWRFLLGNPWPEKSMCFSSGLLAQAVHAVSAENVPGNKSRPGEYDLVVATNPNAAVINKSWQVLCPGGSFYSEWYSPMSGGISRIRKRLELAGFTNVSCYWPWPVSTFAPSLFWLPLDAPQAVHYFLSSRPRRHNQLAQFGSDLLHIIWNIGLISRLLVPICVVANKSETSLKTNSTENPAWELTDYLTEPVKIILWTGGKRSINKVILYLFHPGEEKPHLVVKLPRTPEAVPPLIHEAHILQALHTEQGDAAKRAPAILFLNRFSNMVALGESPVFGHPMYAVLNRENALGLAIKVTDWLVSLVSDEPLRPRIAWWDKLVESALFDFEKSFSRALDDDVIPKCQAILKRLDNLPSAFEHRDCSPWNILVASGGELAVLDWESAEPDGLPGIDLTYFLTYLAFFMDGAMKNKRFIESYRSASDPATITGRVQLACQYRYFESTGIDPTNLHPLRLLTWLIHSRSEVRHLVADTRGIPTVDALQHSLFFNLVLEEIRTGESLAQAGNQ